MKHVHKRAWSLISKKKHLIGALGVISLTVGLFGIFIISRGAVPHMSELAFTETSILGGGAGSVIPASGHSAPYSEAGYYSQSGYYSQAGYYSQSGYYSQGSYPPDYSQSTYYSQGSYPPTYSEGGYYDQGSYYAQGSYQTWTAYCTGPSDVNGNHWQVWEYDNSSPTLYRSTGGNCNPTPTLSTVPSTVNWNSGTSITWSSANTSSCTAGGDWGGTKSSSGSQAVTNLTASQTYTLYCTNNYGQTSSVISTTATVCPYATPTWNGSACVAPTGDIIPNTCGIAMGATSCSMNVAWATVNAPGAVEVRRNYDAGSVLATGASGNNSYSFPYSPAPYIMDLYDALRNELLDSASFVAGCLSGGWDISTGRCVNPTVSSVVVTGQYYSTPGNIAVTCTNASRYRVTHSESSTTIVNDAVYPGSTVNVPVTLTGNYVISCLQGGYASTPPVVRFYNAGPPPAPTITVVASPRTIPKNSASTISWSIAHPRTNCTLTARTICANGVCDEDQTAEAARINQRIATENIDKISSQEATRTILNSLRYIPASRMDTDWTTDGRKAFSIKYSTEFTASCGASSQSVRVLVTTTGER